jgi:hypothetical protein
MRPAPPLLANIPDPKRHGVSTEVYEITDVFVLTYRGAMAGMRNGSRTDGWKYATCIWASRGTADMMAARLNRRHKTNDFGVAVLRR